MNGNCQSCTHSQDYGESVEYIKCEDEKKGKYVRKGSCCQKYEYAGMQQFRIIGSMGVKKC